MTLVYTHADRAVFDWQETLAVASDLGLPRIFSLEWLIDKAERQEWSGLWW
ncbi:hypothetical protein [Candidatus Rhodobacter oscarellae]|uniref:hypothetical protein n=1 Tax=Candidatus Rhodobacter oscarellae TaxID=1675527 RepID=UPI000A923EBE|nr:hypothetical protein [Candidatus Rhodobacter lobularis]